MNDILSKVLSTILGGLIMGALALYFGAFDKRLSDSQVEEVALQIINEESASNVLLRRLSEDGRFVGAT